MQISVFADLIVVGCGLVCLGVRFAGKFAGIYLGARVTEAPIGVRRFLGFRLFPQAGVAISLGLFVQGSGMASAAGLDIQRLIVLLVNIVMLSVLINELIGPSISRFGVKHGIAAQR